MSEQSAIEIRGSKHPIHDRKGQVHVSLHHNGLVMMRGVVTTNGVDERHISHEPIVVDVAAEMHELIDQVHGRGGGDEQPCDIRSDEPTKNDRARDRHEGESRESVWRKECHPVIHMIGETHLLLGKELMMHQGVPIVDRPE